MTAIVVRPPAGNMSDNNLATYDTVSGGWSGSLVLPTLPAGATVTRVRLRADGSGAGQALLRQAGAAVPGVSVAWDSFLGSSYPVESSWKKVSWSQAQVNTVDLHYSSTSVGYVHELYLDVVYLSAATVVVSAPAGSSTDQVRPVAWTATLDPDADSGAVQAAFEAKIFDQATYSGGGFNAGTSDPAWTSGVVYGTATGLTPDALAPGNYRAYVRVAQTVNSALLWSAWATNSGYTIVSDPPVLTAVTATAGDGPELSITVARNTGSPLWVKVDVERSKDGGTTWTQISSGPPDSSGSHTVTDQIFEQAIPVRYRARGATSTATSAWMVAASIDSWTLTGGLTWLVSPSIPELSMQVVATQAPVEGLERRHGLSVPLGASVAAGGFDALIERERSLTVFADGEQVIDALRRLAVGSPVVRVAHPMGRGAHDMWALITSLSFDVLSSTPEPVRMVQVGLLPTVEPA